MKYVHYYNKGRYLHHGKFLNENELRVGNIITPFIPDMAPIRWRIKSIEPMSGSTMLLKVDLEHAGTIDVKPSVTETELEKAVKNDPIAKVYNKDRDKYKQDINVDRILEDYMNKNNAG